MTDDQTPVATEADVESLSRKLRVMTETLTPVERSILEALIRATDEEVAGYWSVGIGNPFGGTVSVGPDSVLGFFGFGSSSGPTHVVTVDRSGSRRDPRSERHQHR